MKGLALFLSLVVVPGALGEETAESDPFVEMGWQPVAEVTGMPSEVERDVGTQEPISLVEIEAPALAEPNHLVAGMVRYESVSGTGYLEMWTVYGEQERYFSRTLGDFGPMAVFTGSSDWRPVMLPFRGEAGRIPESLEVNVVLPGGGKVEFRDFRLYEVAAQGGEGWWSMRSGVLGGIVASLAAIGGGLAMTAGLA